MAKVLVTGGSGFIGAALCKELLEAGHEVRILDDQSRGRLHRIAAFADKIEMVPGDVRDPVTVHQAARGCEVVWHLAYVNGTRYFYEKPDLVLEVGIKGAVNSVEAALACGARRYVLASTSETYNVPTHVPTNETERLMIPDVTNPRFSYGGGKIASELIALHWGGKRGLETVIFRPHNVYGPDMGFEHVIPEITQKIVDLSNGLTDKSIKLPIQGDGSETRSFCFIDDGARGARIAGDLGEPGNIYHLGSNGETSIKDLILGIAKVAGIEVELVSGELRPGGTPRRAPDISKLGKLGYTPKVSLEEGLQKTVPWYVEHFLKERAYAKKKAEGDAAQ